jgi:hypothetical protein
MASVDYIAAKAEAALEVLAGGSGSFERRLYLAYEAALSRLSARMPPAELADDLGVVLVLCRRHLTPGGMSPVPAADRRHLAGALVGLLADATRLEALADG